MICHRLRNRSFGAKRKFVYLNQGYYGETQGPLAVCDVSVIRDTFDPLRMRADYVDLHESAMDVAGCWTVESLEPMVQGETSMSMHLATYLHVVRVLRGQHQVTLIVNETWGGCGNNGSLFVFKQTRLSDEPKILVDLILFVVLYGAIFGLHFLMVSAALMTIISVNLLANSRLRRSMCWVRISRSRECVCVPPGFAACPAVFPGWVRRHALTEARGGSGQSSGVLTWKSSGAMRDLHLLFVSSHVTVV